MMTMLREVPPPDQSSPSGPLDFLRPFVTNVTQISGPAIIMKFTSMLKLEHFDWRLEIFSHLKGFENAVVAPQQVTMCVGEN